VKTKKLIIVIALSCCALSHVGFARSLEPVVSFNFEGNTDNETGKDISAAVIGNLGYTKGLEGKSLSFKTSDSLSYLTIDSNTLPFKKDQDFSVQFWIKSTMDSDKPFVMLAQKDYKDNSLASQKTPGWVMYSYGGTWAWTMGSDGRRVTHENENGQHMPLNDGKWHQLAMTYDSANAVIRLYYDGENKALYKVRDTRGFDFTNDRPLVVGWNGDNGVDTQKPVLQAIYDGAKLLQELVGEFNRFGFEQVKTNEIVDMLSSPERFFYGKIDKKAASLPESERDVFCEKMKSSKLDSVKSLLSKLKSNPYTIYQNRNLTAISAVAKLYYIEGENVKVRPDVAEDYTKKTKLHQPIFEMDCLKIWDRVLASSEVIRSYAKHRKPDVKPLRSNVGALTAACWNIWHGGKHFNVKEHGWDSRLKIAEMLKEENADVVMMQETYSSGDFIAAELGYYFAASVDWDYLNQGANLSVISRYPIEEMYVPETSSFMDCGVKVSLSKTQDMYVMSNWYGMNEFNNVFEYHKPQFAESDAIPMLFAGDFNAVPHTDGGRSPASKTLLGDGFTDAYRSLYPDVEKYKGATHRSGSRIDQIYYKGAGLKNTSTKVISTAQPGFPSDHFLIISKFDLDYTTNKKETISKAYYPSNKATVLLITSDSLAKAWKPFADWKTSIGKATKITTVEQIENLYEGRDVQQKIRACSLDHINNNGTKWVILGGDSQPDGKGLVPDRDTKHSDPPPTVTDIPTDIYYISEKDWDANDDGVYGDWKNDKDAISYTNPRACIGRIPLRTTGRCCLHRKSDCL